MIKCGMCSKEFKDKSGLTGHVRMIHPSAVLIDGAEFLASLDGILRHLALKPLGLEEFHFPGLEPRTIRLVLTPPTQSLSGRPEGE